MDEPRFSSGTACSSSFSSRSYPGPIAQGLAPSDEGPPLAKRPSPRVEAEPLALGSSARGPEEGCRELVSMAIGLYPLGQAEALHGLAVVLEKADACGGAARGVVECCYSCATELMRNDDEDVRLAVVQLVRCCRYGLFLLRLFDFKVGYNLRD
jgi:integrator complex subunit 4